MSWPCAFATKRPPKSLAESGMMLLGTNEGTGSRRPLDSDLVLQENREVLGVLVHCETSRAAVQRLCKGCAKAVQRLCKASWLLEPQQTGRRAESDKGHGSLPSSGSTCTSNG